MKLIKVVGNLRKKFIKFKYFLYKNDLFFTDTCIYNVKNFLYKKHDFAKKCTIEAVYIEENNNILCQCIFIFDDNSNDVFMSFFDAIENASQAVDMLVDYGKQVAVNNNKNKLVIGLNGHLSYGVGILKNLPSSPVSFDTIYNKSYYSDYFNKRGFAIKSLSTYESSYGQALDKLATYNPKSLFTTRLLQMNNFKKEMIKFGDLCNKTLCDTDYYYKTSDNHFVELIGDMKFFLKSENIIFLLHNGIEVGFIFWHPDYHEIFSHGKKNSMLSLARKYILNKNKIKKMKINAYGILPEYRSTKAIAQMFNSLQNVTKNRFDTVETSFVWDNNWASYSNAITLGFDKELALEIYLCDVKS